MKFIEAGMAAAALVLSLASCNNYLDNTPRDQMSPVTTWKTADDADKFLIGCYDGWDDYSAVMYRDCGSDFGYNHFTWEGYNSIGNGSMTPDDPGWSYYDFSTIRKVNTLLENIDNCTFSSEAVKKNIIAQAKAIRAYRYFILGANYGGVPIIDNFSSAEEAQVPRNTEEEVKNYIYADLDAAIPDLNEAPSEQGRIAKGAALAILMRAAMYWGDFQKAKDAAQQIIDLGQYALEPGIEGFHKLFTLDGRNSKEIILAYRCVSGTYSNWVPGCEYNNGDGGWSSVVPTQNCVDNFEMSNGKAITEEDSGYDPTHPFFNRDPRLYQTVIYPGRNWNGGIYNTLDATLQDGSKNPSYPGATNNSSFTALTWAKYLDPQDQYADMWDTDCSPIVFRYADVLLSWAEAENELNGPSAEVYNKLNMVRERVGMPDVDRTKYNTKDKLRTLIRRERGSELADEGLRRYDIIRWKDNSGKMVAETVLNGELTRIVGHIDYNVSDPTRRAVVDPSKKEKVEDRVFKDYNKYLPIPLSNMKSNLKLTQNPGYGE